MRTADKRFIFTLSFLPLTCQVLSKNLCRLLKKACLTEVFGGFLGLLLEIRRPGGSAYRLAGYSVRCPAAQPEPGLRQSHKHDHSVPDKPV